MTEAPLSGPRVLVGGVGELYQGDLDLGRRAAELLAGENLGEGVLVEDLSYGAVAVCQRLQELAPEVLILVGASERGRAPGSVERREVVVEQRSPEEIQRYITDAVTGYVDIELLLEVAHGLGGLPARVILIEAEPVSTEPSENLSAEAETALVRMLELARAEVAQVSSSTPRL